MTDDWVTKYLSGLAIQPFLAEIKMGKIRPSVVLLAIQRLTSEEKRQMKPVIDQVLDALRCLTQS